MKLVVDIGNTLVKYALFENYSIINIVRSNDLDISIIESLFSDYNISSSIFSSVRKDVNLPCIDNSMHLSYKTDVPIELNYLNIETLGSDRIANMVAAATIFPDKDVLVLDAGTCITIDFINKFREYIGGRISPGIQMRYDSLNYYTSRLPKESFHESFPFLGNDTSSSIISGVQSAVIAEVEDIISRLTDENYHFDVVVTGGDTLFFEKELKSSIFADKDFTLKGLYEILKYNE